MSKSPYLDRLLTTTVVTNVKGGVGKSSTAQLYVAACDERDGLGTWKLIQIDDQRSSTQDGGMLAKRIDLSIGSGADIRDVEVNAEAAVEHFDSVGALMLNHNCVLDQGANVQRDVLSWLERSRFISMADRKGVGFDVVAVTDGTIDSIEGAIWVLRSHAALLSRAKVKPRFFVVLNDRNGKGFSGAAYENLLAVVKDIGAETIEVPFGRSKLLYEGLQRRLTALDCLLQADELAKAIGIYDNEVRREREKFDLEDFLAECQTAIATMLPPQKVAA